jgi:hypothetical protein
MVKVWLPYMILGLFSVVDGTINISGLTSMGID